MKAKSKRLNKEETKEKMIQYILDHFDFEKCETAMTLLGWEWWDVGIPSIERLKESAKERLEDVIDGCLNSLPKHDRSPYFSSSGGLKATAGKNIYGHLEFLELEFVLTDWRSDGDYLDDLHKRN